ncbi:MAG: amidohydrolase family protein [Pelovirga sp.]
MAQIVAARYLQCADGAARAGGALLCEGGRISAVGDLAQLRRAHPAAAVHDYPEALLVPLLVNAHTHLELTDFPHWADQAGQSAAPESFVDWILRLIAVKKNREPDDYLKALKNGIEQCLAAGTGAVGDILAHYDARSGYLGTPLGGRLFLETLGQDPAMIRRLKKRLNEVLDQSFDAPVSLGVSPHSPYTISNSYLRYIYQLCKKRRLRCTTHVAESADEVTFTDDSRGALAERFYPAIGWEGFLPLPAGVRPVAYLEQQGGLFPENLLVHGVHLDGSDIDLLARKGMSLALCPRSNANLKVGKAPVAELRKAGVRLVLGTDSRASAGSLSLWDEMAFARTWFAGALDPPTLLHMATLGGAEALGIADQYGSLEPGKRAAFQLLRAPEDLGIGEIPDYLSAGITQSDIIQVYCDGQPRRSGVKG